MNIFGVATCSLLLGVIVAKDAKAQTFTSLHVFGDGVSRTVDVAGDPLGPPEYFGERYCNGRTWVEVLAQWQDIPLTTNQSVFGHISGVFTGGVDRPAPFDLQDNLAAFSPPADTATALFVLWVCDADFVEFLGIAPFPYDEGDLSPGGDRETWTTLITDSVDNHEAAINTLYGMGVRHLVLPPAVDITVPPEFNLTDPADNAFIRNRVIEFNVAYAAMLETLLPSLPGLKVYRPDMFTLFDDIVANPGDFGAINPLKPPGTDPDLYAVGLDEAPIDFDGPGASYVFWDTAHPTALIQMFLADLTQQEISPPRITGIVNTGGGFDLTLENVPVGRDGRISGSSNLIDWFNDKNVTSTSTTQVESVPSPDAARYFRADFPVIWSWP